MKFLVVVSACLAVTAASHPGAFAGYAGYTGPYADVPPAGVPALVAHPNGAVTPADTPSVLAARADHLAAKGAIYGAGYGLAAPALPAVAAAPLAVAAPAIAAPVAAPIIAAAPVAYGYTGPLADSLPASAAGLQSLPNGAVVPKDTPSVVAARADHLAAKGAIYAASAPIVAAAPLAAPAIVAPAPAIAAVPAVAYGYTGPLADSLPASAAGLVSLPNGAVVPKDTPSVVAARADHLAAKGAVYAATAPIVASGPAIAAPALAVAAPALPIATPALPVAGSAYAVGAVPVGPASPTGALVSFPNGAVVPADEPAVAAARADHLAAKGGLAW